jgi:hypothetical protein
LDAANKLECPQFPSLVRRFLRGQLYPDLGTQSPNLAYPSLQGHVSIVYSAVATFRAPSDISGMNGMHREHIRATQSWRQGKARYDCVFINSNSDLDGMGGLEVARVLTFFAFTHQGREYPSALIHWYSLVGTQPDEDTGLWMVSPDRDENGYPHLAIIHIDSIYRAAHLIPVYRNVGLIDKKLTLHDSLDTFDIFYVNKFVDHHAFEIAF